jgi:hypothetical protein
MIVKDAIKRSSETFQSVVWPELSPLWNGATIVPVETVTDSQMAKVLDMYAGIDMWMLSGQSLYGIASRVQYGPTSWDTFTVRYRLASGNRTEYHKRQESLKNGSLYPRWTIQAYVDGERLVSAAITTTERLVEMCQRHEHQVRRAPGGNEFIYVGWDQFDTGGVYVHRPEVAA